MSAKRRKVDAVVTPRSTTRGIAAFTRTTKALASSGAKDVLMKNAIADSPISVAVGGKRKLQAVEIVVEESVAEEIEIDHTSEEATAILNTTADDTPATVRRSERAIRPLPQRRVTAARTPKTPYRKAAQPSSPIPTPGSVQTPTNGLQGLLDKFFLPSSPASVSAADICDESDAPANGSSQATSVAPQDELPTELQDMINLHSSFLTALTLHYAHNGTHTPCDLRQLLPNIARCWGKRAVTLLDIKRILGILNRHAPSASQSTLADLSLSDYGQGKICIDIRTSGRQGRIAKPLDENAMNAAFIANLELLWADADTANATEFVKGLEMEEVRMCASVAKMSPLLAKGQRRLEDLRYGLVTKKLEDEAKAAEAAKDVEMMSPGTKKPTLLERLRMKAEASKNAPPPLTKEELARRAALGRLEEVVAVLHLLSTSSSVGQARISFTLPTIIGKLKDSFKTPIAKSEAELCVRVLCELAPEWCKLVKMGRGEAIVVSVKLKPSDADMAERVRKALA